MDCSEILELLPLYSEDMLDISEKAMVDEHLKTCVSCKEELEFLRKIQIFVVWYHTHQPCGRYAVGVY